MVTIRTASEAIGQRRIKVLDVYSYGDNTFDTFSGGNTVIRGDFDDYKDAICDLMSIEEIEEECSSYGEYSKEELMDDKPRNDLSNALDYYDKTDIAQGRASDWATKILKTKLSISLTGEGNCIFSDSSLSLADFQYDIDAKLQKKFGKVVCYDWYSVTAYQLFKQVTELRLSTRQFMLKVIENFTTIYREVLEGKVPRNCHRGGWVENN